MALRDYLRGEVVEDFADGLLTRREALRRLGFLGLGLTGASSLLAACSSDAEPTGDAAATTTASPESSTTAQAKAASTSPSTTSSGAGAQGEAELIRFPGSSGELQAAWATPEEPVGAVLVIHENRGLTPHFHDLVTRLAGAGYAALAVDLLSPEGGTASLADDGAAQGALGAAPAERLSADLRAGLDELERREEGSKLGAVGFCFGGGMAWNLLQAGEDRLAAVVPFYGPAPENPDFSGARAAVLGIYAELDTRVNASRDRAEQALQAAGLTHEIRTFAGADHAFFNDTGSRYQPDAAAAAYDALLSWFGQHLS